MWLRGQRIGGAAPGASGDETWLVVWAVGLFRLVDILSWVFLFVGVLALIGAVWRWMWRHWRWAAAGCGVVLVVQILGWNLLGGLVLVAVWMLVVVWWQDRDDFDRFAWWARSWWLRMVSYRRWPVVMEGAGLSKGLDRRGRAVVPVLARVSRLPWSDRLLVGLLAGQDPSDVEAVSGRIAHGLRSRACRVWTAEPGWVWVELARGDDPLARVFGLSIPARAHVRLDAVPVGVLENGELWRVPLLGSHVFVSAATGAGKSSLLWSLVRSVCPAIADDTVRVWAVDPKGGMELGGGKALFSRFATSASAAAELLEDAVTAMHERAARLVGVTRVHHPSPGDPLVVILVDELAALVSYEPSKALRDRITNSLNVLLSQGRAAGCAVVAAVQDPRKNTVTFRDLFPHRVAMRLDEPAQVDLVLGDGARDRGAMCDQIPRTDPGVGYVRAEGAAAPVRVRAGWVTDEDIAAMCQDYPAPVATPDETTAATSDEDGRDEPPF
jgi:DNA segregation ATPase FtsK/SpoIIIE, S-DNA-T family